jgi:hypothetical protein
MRCRSSSTITPCCTSAPASAFSSSASAREVSPLPSCAASASGAMRQGRSNGSSAALRQAKKRWSSSSSSSMDTQASARPGCGAARLASSEVLP